jgi:RsiW-degrading membrane proteinase PrsW (M82 family)
MYINGIMSDVYIRTTETIFMMAFLQVAFIEELCKFASLKLSDYGRGKRKKDIDSHYSIMFYCAIVSASFAIMESLNYAQRTMAGEFGLFITPKEVLFVRSFTSVILHMVCGLFMGYFIALSKGKNFYMKTLYSLIGIIAATIAHGIYDFMLMLVKDQKDMFFLGKNMYVYTPTIMLLLVYVFLAYLASNDLKKKYIESSIY